MNRMLVCIAILCALVPALSSKDCPGTNQAEKKTGTYHFTYESWVEKAKQGSVFLFGRCVQTKNGADLFVDWKEAGVKGYARPGEPVHNEVPWPNRDEKTVKADLWYGATRDKMEAPYKEVKDKAAISVKATPILVSRISMSLSRTEKPKAKEDFIRIDMEFTSKLDYDGKTYRCVQVWKNGPELPANGVPFRLKSDAFIKPLKDKNLDFAKVSASSQTLEARWQKSPVWSLRSVEFLDREGKEVIGTAVVAVYEPKGTAP